ncbi:hypothetical protein EVAR_50121_1 [Eumeta japonica]|uniref:Uncharacterized protein n=1 Tax=Eumeta variegata TaxID=151549 RepID=A0A4C1YPU5_EUMVA|nr:hypothetical protein EVAR_50121_1 [Eumeta japonica]
MKNQNRKNSYWSWCKVAAITGASTLVVFTAWRLTRSALDSIFTRTPRGNDEELANVVDGVVFKLNTSPSEVDSLTSTTQQCNCQSNHETITPQEDINEDINNHWNSASVHVDRAGAVVGAAAGAVAGAGAERRGEFVSTLASLAARRLRE